MAAAHSGERLMISCPEGMGEPNYFPLSFRVASGAGHLY